MKAFVIAIFLLFILYSNAQTDTTNNVFTFVEYPPQFPGGDKELIHFLQENITYPQHERDYDIEGRVLLKFVVDTDGSVGYVSVVKPACQGLDSEAVRVVKMLPKFIPGTQQGKAVRVYFNLPIVFKLTDSKSKADNVFAEKMSKDEFFKKAILLGEKGKYKEAAIQIKKSISHFPNDYLGYEYQGICHVELKKSAEACNDFNRAKELGSPNAEKILKKHCQ